MRQDDAFAAECSRRLSSRRGREGLRTLVEVVKDSPPIDEGLRAELALRVVVDDVARDFS